MTFRYRKSISKKEINEALHEIDDTLGKALFLQSASIIPDGEIIKVKDDNGKWHVVVVSEAKFQGKDIDNLKAGIKVGKNNNNGTLNKLDRLTATNYGMKVNTNLCKNKFVPCNSRTIMLQAASIYTQGDGGHWKNNDMINVMLDIARTSLKAMFCLSN